MQVKGVGVDAVQIDLLHGADGHSVVVRRRRGERVAVQIGHGAQVNGRRL